MPTTKPKYDLAKLEGRYCGLWGTTDVLVLGDKVIVDYPAMRPLGGHEELKRIDNTTFKVPETNSFESEGELVHFNIKNGKVETVNYNGTTLWPEEIWERRQTTRKIVKLES